MVVPMPLRLALPLLALAALSLPTPAGAAAGSDDDYVATGTVVLRRGAFPPPFPPAATIADNGLLACNKSTAEPSVGGGCVAFGSHDSVLVTDDALGTDVAFQVCIDNDGDGLCVAGTGACADDLYFSHDDDGSFHNPLGPLPTGFRTGCPGGDWDGYAVFLCIGAHSVAITEPPHAHAATSGRIEGATGGTGFGEFCFGPPPQAKAYVVL